MNIRYILSAAVILSFLACGKVNPVDGAAGAVEYENIQHKSSKRGVAFSFGQLPEYDCPLLGPAVSWSYDWSNNVPSAKVQEQFDRYGMEYIQMTWNDQYSPDSIRKYKREHPEVEYILAFNEPNLTDQADMTPAEAAAFWPAVKALASELGLKIVSPAMNYGTKEGYSDPWKWLDEFFAQPGVSLDDVDGIAIHCYMGSVSALKDYINGFKKYGKPIWLTEFCNWDNNNVSESAQMKYMCEAINYLEGDPDVIRYAWFIPRGNGNRECHNNLLTSGRLPISLTSLGEVFVNMSTQDKSVYYPVGQVIPAEHYSSVSGNVHLAPVTDESGLLELYDLLKDYSVEYLVDVPSDGTYSLEIRYSAFRDGQIELSSDAGTVSLALPQTEKEWVTVREDIALTAGRQALKITGASGVSPKYNWFRLTGK